MLDRLGSVASEAVPAVDLMGKLSVRALDSLPLPLLIVLFLFCLALINVPTSNQSVLPQYSPSLIEKDRFSPQSPFPPTRTPQFNTGIFTNTPTYVAVISTSRRNSRLREWRGSSLDIVQEVDEKREELC